MRGHPLAKLNNGRQVGVEIGAWSARYVACHRNLGAELTTHPGNTHHVTMKELVGFRVSQKGEVGGCLA